MRLDDRFSLEEVRKKIIDVLSTILSATNTEKTFWNKFNKGVYEPSLILSGDMLDRTKDHPMAIWKCSHNDAIMNNNKNTQEDLTSLHTIY